MTLTFKDGTTAEIVRVAFRGTYDGITMDHAREASDTALRECRERMERHRQDPDLPAYLFLDPAQAWWPEQNGTSEWRENYPLLPLCHYTMKASFAGTALNIDWFGDAPQGEQTLDGMLRKAAAVVDFSQFAR